MSAQKQALALVGDIYDAALDPALWTEALRKITGFIGGASTTLHAHDVVAQKGRFYFSWGDDPHFTKLYLEKYIKICPTAASVVLLKVGDVCSGSDFLPVETFRTTRFYKEWAQPAGYGDVTLTLIDKSAAVATYLATAHADDQSPANSRARERMGLIGPHVRRAVAIGNVIDMHTIEAGVLADAVDALAAGVFLVREDSRLVRVNTSGRTMLNSAGMLRLDDGRLAAVEKSARQALSEAVAKAAAGDVAVGAHGIAIALISGEGARHVAHVLPLTSGKRRQAGLSHRAAAAVFVHGAAFDRPLPLEAIAKQFNLSAAELRVLIAIIEVGGVPEVAPVLGLSEPTVKTHLRRLFEKTGTKRQADLVKLVAGYSNPFFGEATPPDHPIG